MTAVLDRYEKLLAAGELKPDVDQQKAAAALHSLLYILIIVIPLSGYFYSLAAGVPVVYLGIVPLPVFIGPDPELKLILKQVHYALNMSLLAAVVLHIAAALKHQFLDKDNELRKMLPFLPDRGRIDPRGPDGAP